MARKKRGKSLLLLSLVLLLLLGATAAVMTLLPDEDTEAEESVNEGVEILTLKEEDASAINWTVNGETFAMDKDGEDWVLSSDPAFPLSQEHMSAIFTDLGGLLSYNTLENVTDLAEYGLDDPTAVIHVDDANKKLVTIHLGDAAPMDSLRYLSLGDGKVYMVSNAILQNYNVTLDDLMAYETIPTFKNHKSIRVISGDAVLELNCQTNSQNGEKTSIWTCGEQELDAEKVKTFCDNISSLSWLDCEGYGISDFAPYGLDAPSVTAAVLWHEDDGTELSFTLEIGADKDESSCYARIAGSDMVYSIDRSVRDALTQTTVSDLLPTAE